MSGLATTAVSALYALGVVLLFVGERLVSTGTARGVVSLLGAALMVLATVLRAARISGLDDERAKVERNFLTLQLVGLLGGVLYFFASDASLLVLRKTFEQTSPKLATVLGVLYPIAFGVALLPLLLGELAYRGMARARQVEGGRVQDALLTGLGVVGLVVFAFSAYEVSDARDVRADLSYFRTTKPGAATQNFVRALTEPVEISVFFPPANDVGDLVQEYFRDLSADAPKLHITRYDQAVDPAKARELGVTSNGTVVVAKGTRRESISLPLEQDHARGELKSFDGDVLKKLLAVARAKRTLYLTQGHGERTASDSQQLEHRPTIRAFRDMLKDLNADVKDLSAAEGLAGDVPKDAAAVMVVGPTREFMPEEQAALKRYFEQGGRVLYALDPEAGQSYSGLMAPLGVTFQTVTLANEKVFVPRTHEPSDHALLATASFSSSPSVTTLSAAGTKAPVIFVGAGYVDPQKNKPPNLSIDMSVLAQPETFNDVNGNFVYDQGTEMKKAWPIMASITSRRGGKGGEEGRAVVLADSDCFSDIGVFDNRGNLYLAMDVAKWLLGEDSAAGGVSSEQDVPIEHSRGQDTVWFYGAVFGMPALVLAAGFGVTRRRRRAS